MRALLSFVAIFTLVTPAVFAGEGAAPPAGKHFRGGWCQLELSEEQQTKIRSEKFKFEDSKIDLMAQLMRARLNYKKVLANPGADYNDAKSAAKEVASAMAKLVSAKALFRANIAFNIFTADQRKEAAKCHHGGFGHRPHFGPPSERMGMEEEGPAPEQEEAALLDVSEG